MTATGDKERLSDAQIETMLRVCVDYPTANWATLSNVQVATALRELQSLRSVGSQASANPPASMRPDSIPPEGWRGGAEAMKREIVKLLDGPCPGLVYTRNLDIWEARRYVRELPLPNILGEETGVTK